MYTHRVTSRHYSETFNLMLTDSYRTTADAIVLHEASMRKALASGQIESFKIEALDTGKIVASGTAQFGAAEMING